MKHSALSSLSVLSLFIGTLTLVGCGGAFSMPDSSAGNTVAAVAGPPIQGSVFGGHAPIQGAHVYLLQPGITGYGSAATSLLGNNGATSAGSYVLSTDVSDPNVPTSGGVSPKYVTTNANGEFNLTGAYSCQVGQPVYIYAYGGNIGTTTTTPTNVTLPISSASVNHTGGYYVYTFTVDNANPVPLTTANGPVTLSLTDAAGNGNANWPSLDGSQAVYSANSTSFVVRSTTNLHISGSATGTAVYTYSQTGGAATTNDNIVQLLTLGNCPSSGNFSTAGNGALNYVYLNEVSTVATAYTFQPFTLPANNNAWDIGVPDPTTHPQALLGIENAADTASQLYNIQGSSTLISSSGDGEGHLANNLTTAGNGIVPQATIDTLANILAACVDTVPTVVGTATTACNDLFKIATADGTTTGTKPVDTATAAINIARYPAGNSSSGSVDTNYAADLFAIPSATVPYVPQLVTPPNDWTIAINFPVEGNVYTPTYTGVSNPYYIKAESLAVDALGQIWITGQGSNSIVRIDHMGTIQPSTAQNYLTYIPGYVSVDGGNNAWTGNANDGPNNPPNNGNGGTGTPIFNASTNGIFSQSFGSGYEFAYVNIADSAGDDYFFASPSGGNYAMFEYPAGSTTGTTPNKYSLTSSGFGANNVAHGAIDASGNFWLTDEIAPYQIAKVGPTGTNIWTYNTNVERPEFPSIDMNGTGWIPSQTSAGIIYEITSGGSHTSLTSGTTGANLTYPFGSAVDGNNNIWVTNRCGAYNACTYPSSASSTLVEINGTGTTTPGTINTAISPPTNFLPETQYPATATTLTAIMPDPLNLAIDPSGNIWITNYTGTATTGSVVEIVGAAAPVVTPLSVAAGSNKLGQKP